MATTTGRATDFITFTRTSNATVTASDGKVKWAGHNLILNSEAFDNASWQKTFCTITPNAIAAPNGTTTADKLVETNSTGLHSVYNATAVALPSGIPAYFCIWAKAAERTWLTINTEASTVSRSYVNLSTGALGTVASGVTLTATPVGDGWYRIVALLAATSGTTAYFEAGTATGDGVYSFTGDPTKGLYLWGAHLYRSDLGGMVANPARGDAYYPTTSAAYYAPRLDYDGATLSPRGLLVEEGRSNLLLHSAAFDVSATWVPSAAGTGSNPVVTANDAVAPDGTTTANKVIFDRGAGNTIGDRSLFYQTVSVTATNTYAVSYWIKAATAGDVGKDIAYRSVAGSGYNTVTLTASWQRITLAEVAASASAKVEFTSRGTISTSNSVGVHLWGAQLEPGSFPTSYIPTGASTATRNADVASVATSAFPYSASEGSLVVAYNTFSSGSDAFPIAMGTKNVNEISVYRVGSSGNVNALVFNSSSLQTDPLVIGSGSSLRTNTKVGFAYKANDLAGSLNGGTVATDTTATIPTVSGLFIGGRSDASGPMNGHIRQITYVPRRMTNAEIIAKTAA